MDMLLFTAFASLDSDQHVSICLCVDDDHAMSSINMIFSLENINA